MTRKEAIDLSLEVWRYLAAHPEIADKICLPDDLYNKIKDMINQCPLCEYSSINKGLCKDCPITFEEKGKFIKCSRDRLPYMKWFNAKTKETRKEAATAIVRLLEAALEKENRNEESD
jgi:macrodomain Ter protein organizer (MatP/YcbG family)